MSVIGPFRVMLRRLGNSLNFLGICRWAWKISRNQRNLLENRQRLITRTVADTLLRSEIDQSLIIPRRVYFIVQKPHRKYSTTIYKYIQNLENILSFNLRADINPHSFPAAYNESPKKSKSRNTAVLNHLLARARYIGQTRNEISTRLADSRDNPLLCSN